VDVLSHPFRLTPTGRVATVIDHTDEHLAECVAVTVLTRKAERPLVPDFGVADPVFDELDVAELNAVLATFGPDVAVTDIDVEALTDTYANIVLSIDTGADDETA
jgi:hypothetical protein